jgi:hypothetical protein
VRLSSKLTGAALAAALAAGTVFASPPAAVADSNCATGASADHSLGSAETYITCTIENATNATHGTPPPSGSYTLPACWIEPQFDGAGLENFLTGIVNGGVSGTGGSGGAWAQQVYDNYKNLTPPFNAGVPGMWWGVACDFSNLAEPSALPAEIAAAGLDNFHLWKWVPAGGAVGAPNPATLRLLAEYAAAQIALPPVDFAVNPGALQTVNLSTRVYSTNNADLQPIRATATLANLGSSTVVATPSQVTVYPNGPASRTVGGNDVNSFTCPMNNGSFGSAATDECSFFYTKSTPNGSSYALSVSVDWTFTWVGHGVLAGPFPINSNPQNLPVQEVQAIVGGH